MNLPPKTIFLDKSITSSYFFIVNLAWVNETQEFDSVLKPGTWDIMTFHAVIVISTIDPEMFACGSQSG